LSLDDILNKIPYKTLLLLKEAKERRLEEQNKAQEELSKKSKSQNIQNQIMNIR